MSSTFCLASDTWEAQFTVTAAHRGWGRGETLIPIRCCLENYCPPPAPPRCPAAESCPCSCFRTAGVRLLGEMPQGDLHAALRNCFAVVNSSMSEGMSAAILEVKTQPESQRRRPEAARPSCPTHPSRPPLRRGCLCRSRCAPLRATENSLSLEPQK